MSLILLLMTRLTFYYQIFYCNYSNVFFYAIYAGCPVTSANRPRGSVEQVNKKVPYRLSI